jgi:hypothetical protein
MQDREVICVVPANNRMEPARPFGPVRSCRRRSLRLIRRVSVSLRIEDRLWGAARFVPHHTLPRFRKSVLRLGIPLIRRSNRTSQFREVPIVEAPRLRKLPPPRLLQPSMEWLRVL